MEYRLRAPLKGLQQSCVSLPEMLLGTALTAMAFGLFILPQHFAAAGVTGFAATIAGYLPLSLSQTVLALNVLFLLLGFVWGGKAFAVKTVASSLLFPLFLQVFSRGGTLCPESPLVSVLIAGTLLGMGTGLILRSGASSGGFCVLGVLLQNRRSIPVAATLHVMDASIILMQAFRQPLVQTVYGIMVITLSAFWVEQMDASKRRATRMLLPEFSRRKVAG